MGFQRLLQNSPILLGKAGKLQILPTGAGSWLLDSWAGGNTCFMQIDRPQMRRDGGWGAFLSFFSPIQRVHLSLTPHWEGFQRLKHIKIDKPDSSVVHPPIILFWITGPVGDLWEKGVQLSPKECIGAHTQLPGTLVGAVDSWFAQLLEGKPGLCLAARPRTSVPLRLGETAGGPGSIPALSSRWQEHHLDCSVPGAASGQAKDNIVSMHRTHCAFLGSQETKSQGRSTVLLDRG